MSSHIFILKCAQIGVMINKSRLLKAKGSDDDFISRADLAVRWGCHIETLKRREKQGSLHPHRFSLRMVRYPLREVRALEQEAGGDYRGVAQHLASKRC